MINLDDFEPTTLKFVIADEKEDVNGYLHKKTKVFYDESSFIDLLTDDYKQRSDKIEGLETAIKERDETITEQNDTIYDLRRQLGGKLSMKNEQVRDETIKEICEIIYDRQSFYNNEPAVKDLYLGYADIVEQLRQHGLWRL